MTLKSKSKIYPVTVTQYKADCLSCHFSLVSRVSLLPVQIDARSRVMCNSHRYVVLKLVAI